MKNIMKIVNSVKDSVPLIKSVTKTIESETKKWISMFDMRHNKCKLMRKFVIRQRNYQSWTGLLMSLHVLNNFEI